VNQSRKVWHTSKVAPGLQVRYLWSYILGVAVPAAAGLQRLCARAGVGRFVAVVGAALSFGYIAASALLVLDSQFGKEGGTLPGRVWEGVHYVTGWYPFSPAVSGLVMIATAGAIITLLVALVRLARGDDANTDVEPAFVAAMS
jgi:hypothetical protein